MGRTERRGLLAVVLAAGLSAACSGSGGTDSEAEGGSCTLHSDCPERFTCSEDHTCEPLATFDGTAPHIVQDAPASYRNVYVGDTLRFTFDEPVRLSPGAVYASVEGGGKVSAEASLSEDQRTVRVRLPELVTPAWVEVRFDGVTDNAGNRWTGYGYRYQYPAWVRSEPERYEAGRRATQLSAAVDADGAAVIAWAEMNGTCDARLHARRFDGAAWQDLGGTLNVSPLPAAQAPSLASGGGKVAMAWQEGGCSGAEIHVAMLGPAGFTQLGSALTSGGSSSAEQPSLELDAQGRPVVAWFSSDLRIRAARWDGAAWVQLGESVSDAGRQAYSPSLAIAPDGKPCVAFHDQLTATGSHFVNVRCFDGSAWLPLGSVVDSEPTAAPYLTSRTLAFDASGAGVLAYAVGYDVRVAEQVGAEWRVFPTTWKRNMSASIALVAIDPLLGPMVGRCDDREVRAQYRGSSGWTELDPPIDVYGLAFVGSCALATGKSGPWMPWIEDDTDYGTLPRAERFNRVP